MAWYYYSGKVARPIPVKRGLSKSVRPRSRVEILEETMEVKVLIRKGELRRTGKPKGAPSVADEPAANVAVKDVVEKSELAQKFAEKGKTTGPGIPPVAKDGPEMTEAELNTPAVDKVAPPSEDGKASEDVAEEVDRAGKLPDDVKKKGSKKRRRRT